MIRFIVKDELFDNKINVIIGPIEDYRKFVKRKWKDTDTTKPTENTGAAFVEYYCKNYILWFNGIPKPSVFVHETFHATITILSNLGIPCTAENSEVGAYYVSWLLDQIQIKLSKIITKMEKHKKNNAVVA